MSAAATSGGGNDPTSTSPSGVGSDSSPDANIQSVDATVTNRWRNPSAWVGPFANDVVVALTLYASHAFHFGETSDTQMRPQVPKTHYTQGILYSIIHP